MADPSQPLDRHAWHGARGRSGRPDTRQARQRKIYILAAVMLVLAATVAALLFYLRDTPRPTLVLLRLDQYRDPRILVSPWAMQDREGLRALGLPEKNTFTSQEKQLLLQELGLLGRKQPSEQPLLIYLCAYAAVKDDGTVCVLPADAKLNDAATWLSFKDVLAAIKDCPVKHRLLLLDLALPCVDPSAGLLSANVPEQLKAVLDTAVKDDPNLQILSACAPGQTSLASEELSHTVFAHYLIQGLAGRADGFPNKKADNRVKVRELVDYVTNQVDRWAYANYGVRQTPEFFGSLTTDYELTGSEDNKAPGAAPLPRDYPAFLLKGWQERDEWWNERTRPTPPDQLIRLEQTLLRADEHWRKGDDADKTDSDLRAALERQRRQHADSVGGKERTEPRSLAEAVARGQERPKGSLPDNLRQLKELANLWGSVKQFKPMEKPSEADLMRLAMLTEKFLKKYEDKAFDLCWTIFNAALKDKELRPQDLRCWCELLKSEGKPLPDYAEIQYLQRLAELPVLKSEDWPSAAPEALQLVELAEQVETFKPAKQPWLIEEYADARKQRDEAEKLLFSPLPAERSKAARPIAKTLRAYEDLQQHLVILRDAQRTRLEALVFLPGYPPYLEHDSSRLDIWLDAVQTTRDLQELLAKTPPPEQVPTVLREVNKKEAVVRNSLKKMREPLDNPLARGPIDESRPVQVADAQEMRALLRLPGLTAPQRKTIWNNARDLAGKLNQQAVQREATTDTLPPSDDARAVREESNRALLRARISQGLLRLAGSADVDKVDAARKQVERTPLEPTAWEALRRELRQAWQRQDAATTRP